MDKWGSEVQKSVQADTMKWEKKEIQALEDLWDSRDKQVDTIKSISQLALDSKTVDPSRELRHVRAKLSKIVQERRFSTKGGRFQEDREARRARLLEVASKDLSLEARFLAERFGFTLGYVNELLRGSGLSRGRSLSLQRKEMERVVHPDGEE